MPVDAIPWAGVDLAVVESFLAGLLRPFLWIVVLGTLLWLVRKVCPPSVERILFGPISNITYAIGLRLGRAVRAIRSRRG